MLLVPTCCWCLRNKTPCYLRATAVGCAVLFLSLTCSEEVSRTRLNTMRGLGDHARVDEQLYHDYESEDARKVGILEPGNQVQS
jgi:hypothetical protein